MWHHHRSDTPTFARAILHHTDQKGPNVFKGSVAAEISLELDINVWKNIEMIFENENSL